MSKIFEHVMQRRIGDTEYSRELFILEEGPFVFRVVQELHLGQTVPSRREWICPTKEAATEQALRCLHQSKSDNWLSPAS